MDYLSFAIYFLVYGFVICLFITRIGFIKKSGLEPRTIRALLILKVAAGLAIGWLSYHIYNPANDYWDLNREGWNEYQLLLHHPGSYFKNFFHSDYANGYSGFFDSFQSYWNDLKNNLVIKLLSVFNIFTGGKYYLNSLFFNSLIFFGHIALYRVFLIVFPQRKWLVLIGCFLLPSTLYFSSGIHRDGVVFLLIAFFIYAAFSCLKDRFTFKRIMIALVSAGLLFVLRNYVVFALLPALLAWVIIRYTGWWQQFVYSGVYVVSILLFFGVSSIIPSIDPPKIMAQKQDDYMQLPSSVTSFQLNDLSPTLSSFAANSVQSLNHTLLRPYLWELPAVSLLPFCVELFAYQMLLLLFIFFHHRRETVYRDGFGLFLFAFTITAFLFIGYIVPNIGTLVRYRGIYLPLIITPLLACTDWKRVRLVARRRNT